ncbi:MAG: PQQ-binding-like beta-propeller repeat protein [Candidatus Diapherotrites archaeon]|nr:PQQ-binding-like beta-propeller repeat protein [Candidatus Diapherotrites archaeon]
MQKIINVWGAALVLLILLSPLVQAAWPIMQYDNQRAGKVSGDTPDTNHVYWKFNLGDRIRSAPVVDNNTVYITSEDGYLYAIDVNGTQNWKKQIALSATLEFTSSPVINGSTVYVASKDTNVYSLDADDGSTNWSYSAGGSIYSSPILYSDHLIFGSADGKVYDVNATTGNLKWSYNTGNAIWSSPALYNNYIYIGSDSKKVYQLDLSGSLINSYTTSGAIVSSPTIDVNGNVFIGSDDDYFYLLDTNLTYVNKYNLNDDVRISAAINGPEIFIGSDDGKLYSLDSNLSPNWYYDVGSALRSSPAVINDNILFGADNDVFYKFDLNTTRATSWSYTTGDAIHSSPAVDNKVIYVGSDDGYLYAFKDNQKPIADAGGPYADNYIGETINFDGSGSYDPDPADSVVSYNWSFGDGNFGTGMTPSHIYTTSGDFNVTLYVSDGNFDGTSDLTYATIKISNRPPVLSSGSVTPVGGPSTSTYTYSVTLTDPDNHAPALIYVNIDDANYTITTTDPTAIKLGRNYTYSTSSLAYGAHSYYFITQDPEGAWDTLDNNGTAYSGPDITFPPTVTIDTSGTTTTVTVNHTATFKGSATDSDGTVVLYEWDFDGNGTYDWNGTTGDTTHVYTSIGTYTARLRATDDKGATGTDTITINVIANAAPTANAGSDQTLSAGTNVELPGKGTDTDGTITLYEWDFDGDGTYDWNSTTTGITFRVYTDAGIYYAKLRVTDNDAATGTDTAKIEISTGGGGGGGDWTGPPSSDDTDDEETEPPTGTPTEEEIEEEPPESQDLSPNALDADEDSLTLNESGTANIASTETPGSLPMGQPISQPELQEEEETGSILDGLNTAAGTAFFVLGENSSILGLIILTVMVSYYVYKRAKNGRRKDLRWHAKKTSYD